MLNLMNAPKIYLHPKSTKFDRRLKYFYDAFKTQLGWFANHIILASYGIKTYAYTLGPNFSADIQLESKGFAVTKEL